ncbi:MAG TPA: arginine--tRNA ligase [Fibrobacteraceae bacterium]|nr:arginine--tRNA ligase [Fibrobacteraceae bacterium]
MKISFEQGIADAVAAFGFLSADEALALLSVPQESSHGDYSVPCFSLAKILRKAPKIIAEDLASQIQLPQGISRVEALNGYLNFYVDRVALLQQTLCDIAAQGLQYGRAPRRHERVVVDFSSPNIGKELAFHHIRSTMIGNALANIYDAYGYDVVRINHLGDWGTQFGKLIVMYLREGLPTDSTTLENLEIQELNRLYASFSKEAKAHPELEDEARAAFAKLEQGDSFHRTLWTAFKSATLKELNRLYAQMGITFDHYTGESFYEPFIPDVVQELEQKGLLSQSQERDVVLLNELDLPPCLIRKSDGSTLYATRDLAAALYRMRTFQFVRCLYVVDQGQALHFRQVFATLAKMGYDWSDRLVHIPFGLMLHLTAEGKWEKGKTRSGHSSLLRDVIEAAHDKVFATIREKNPDLPDADTVATQIAVSALAFNDLKNRRMMDVKFDWDSALSFEGATGPYVQNAHVRLCSIAHKAGYVVQESQVNWEELVDEHSYALMRTLSLKGQRIRQACECDEAAILAQYSLDIAEAAHRFIHQNRVLGAPEERSRLFLVQCAQLVLEDVLRMIGVFPIRAM